MTRQDLPIKVIGVIPARYGSTRFPGKVLAPILGKPMIQWVYERAKLANCLEEILIATDDARVQAAVAEFGGKAVMTSTHHTSGTDRIAEAVVKIDADIVVNIQGDEPMIDAAAIDTLVTPFMEDDDLQMATLCRLAQKIEEIFDTNTVRVVFDCHHHALYFSRAPIPFNRDTSDLAHWLDNCPYYQHIGVYAYRKPFLLSLAKLPPTPLEHIEKLEQLRVLESGFQIRVVETAYAPVCVDVPADIEQVEKLMLKSGIGNV